MFCNKCGNEMPDGSKFCSSCGESLGNASPTTNQGMNQQVAQGGCQQAPQAGYQQMAQGGYQQAPQAGYQQAPQAGYQQMPQGEYQQVGYSSNEKKKGNGAAFGVLAAVVVLVVAIVGVIVWMFMGTSGGNNPEDIAEKMIDAAYEADVDTFMGCVNKDVLEAVAGMYGYGDAEELIDLLDFETTFEDAVDEVAYTLEVDDDDIMKYIDVDMEDCVEIKGDDFEYLEECYEEFGGIEITEACSIYCDITFEKGDNTYEDYLDLYFVKIGSKWYVDLFETFGF